MHFVSMWMVLAASTGLLTSCTSISPSQYSSPRLIGQVLDQDTRQPLKNVQVRRTDTGSSARSSEPTSGGHLMEAQAAVRTGSDGRFVMKSVRTLGPFALSWYSVTVAFERTGYQAVVRSYTLANSTKTPQGEPVVDAGEVLLPKSK